MNTAQSLPAGTEDPRQASAVAAGDLLRMAVEALRSEAKGASERTVQQLEGAIRQLEAASKYQGPALGAALAASSERLQDAIELSAQLPPPATGTDESLRAEALARLEDARGMLEPRRSSSPAPIQAHALRTVAPDERRSHSRHTFETAVSFESDSNFFTGFTEDLSEGGLFLATYQLRPLGELIDVEFELPDGHIVNATGEVRWLRDLREETPGVRPGMGLRFLDLKEEDREAILFFTSLRQPIFYDD